MGSGVNLVISALFQRNYCNETFGFLSFFKKIQKGLYELALQAVESKYENVITYLFLNTSKLFKKGIFIYTV